MDENPNYFNLTGFLNRPAVVEIFVDLLLCAVPIWLAIMIGLVIGWSWRPRWTGLLYLGLRSKLQFAWTAVPPGFGARRLCLAFSALSAFSVGRTVWVRFRGRGKDLIGARSPVESIGGEPSTSEIEDVVTENDLEHLLHLIESKDGVTGWQSMMERSTSNLTYQAWRHDPETGPIVYCSRTVFEDSTPELVRDFFWDDEFRPKWDPMLTYFRILEEHPHTGTTIVHWIKKFPFFCSDREYIIGRRIWEDGKTYYCVTKGCGLREMPSPIDPFATQARVIFETIWGVPYPALQRRDKPRRVDLYFSSWIIKPVQSRRGDGQFSACEVTLVHYEDMGIPKDVAKLGVRHGMWGTVKKLHSGFRSYQQVRKSEAPLSRSVLMARITTKISAEEDTVPLDIASGEEERDELVDIETTQQHGGIDWKWVVIGGTVVLVCGLRAGVIRKALFLGAWQRVARR